jgi:hypothetical protein
MIHDPSELEDTHSKLFFRILMQVTVPFLENISATSKSESVMYTYLYALSLHPPKFVPA